MTHSSPTRAATGWRAAAGDLLLGASCHGCGTAAWTLCGTCRRVLAARAPGPTQPHPCPPGFPPTWTSGPYDDLARSLVSAHKERGALGLTRVLGEGLALAVLGLLDDDDDAGPDDSDAGRPSGVGVGVVLVPVPSARHAVRERGFDAGLALARAAARRLPRARAAPLLVPARRVADQSGLGAEERHANLAGAYRLRRVAAGRSGGAPVVVVDDVVTSGASLTEAARALRAGGVAVLGAATFAATARRFRPGWSDGGHPPRPAGGGSRGLTSLHGAPAPDRHRN